MRFYITFGKDKEKEKHIINFGEKRKLEFSIIVSQLSKEKNKEYAYLKAETWNNNLIDKMKENVAYDLGNFYFRFYKDKNNNTHFVMVIRSLKNVNEKKEEEENPWSIEDILGEKDFELDFLDNKEGGDKNEEF